MKVTKAQAQANRAHIVETASTLFREHGYDGIGVADLMAEAGFTHGGFYKHFRSKADLIVESAACSLAKTAELSSGSDISELVRSYVSREHRDARSTGCTIAALSGDAARQPAAVQATFADGIENVLAALSKENTSSAATDAKALREKYLDIMAHAVGAIVMSRACPDDSSLADEILVVCRDKILTSLNTPPSEDLSANNQVG
ncbi:TetR/AcrR family transcriptional regulator [Klebsiella michiganensis]|uniref:TetR/AcrR family transcriptional regulator n=1 Tax=Klebsiella michiganensis TaxID=1134687 RepID=UPI0027E76F2F|nr:TetR family transcriptional regulator [Klebsiella michiganensis]MDQ7856397.1 TetR family transcriptional regulator [Klebsiella michiganensis]